MRARVLREETDQQNLLPKFEQMASDLAQTTISHAQQLMSSELINRIRSLSGGLCDHAWNLENGERIHEILRDAWAWAQSHGTASAAQLQVWANALLTTELASSLASWTAETFNRNSDKYDQLIDRVYMSGQGGSSAIHHIIDGNHTLWGAIRAASKAYDDDSTIDEVLNAVEHLLRDFCSRSGINLFFSVTRDQLDTIQDFAGELGLSKSWVNDFLQLNVPEVLGAFFAVVPVWLGWSKLDAEKFAKIAGSAGIAALISANPLLGLVALVAMARSFHMLHSNEETFDRAATSGSFAALQVTVVHIASVAVSGPAFVGIVTGLVISWSLQRYASSGMTHAEMLSYIIQIYTTRVMPAISASSEATLQLLNRLQQQLNLETTDESFGTQRLFRS